MNEDTTPHTSLTDDDELVVDFLYVDAMLEMAAEARDQMYMVHGDVPEEDIPRFNGWLATVVSQATSNLALSYEIRPPAPYVPRHKRMWRQVVRWYKVTAWLAMATLYAAMLIILDDDFKILKATGLMLAILASVYGAAKAFQGRD